jgi:hypothetical protein
MSDEPTTYIRPEYRPVSGRHTVDGVLFRSYSVGISRYTRITEDGQIEVCANWNSAHYTVSVIGHGPILSKITGKPHHFRDDRAAMKAGVALFKKLQAERAK